jgi:hypothetical protein
MKLKTVGLVLAIWGGLGVVNQVLLIQALNSGQAPSVPMIDSVDPASILKIANPSGAGFTSPGMLTDAAILGVGWYLARR